MDWTSFILGLVCLPGAYVLWLIFLRLHAWNLDRKFMRDLSRRGGPD